MSVSEILPVLCRANGVSGRESDISYKFGKLAEPMCGGAYSDALGNCWYESKYNRGGKKVMIEAHADKIGLMVSHITESGFVLFAPVGGIDKKILPAARVMIHGRERIQGVIGSVPPHLKEKQKFAIEDLCIDTGFSAEKLKGMIGIGDMIELASGYTVLSEDRVASSALDDRAGLAVLIRLLELVGDESKYDIIIASSVQEEVGMRGAGAAANAVKPDIYICIDVTHGTTHDNSNDAFDLGRGPAIGVGPNMTPCITEMLINTANEQGIEYQLEVMGGTSGTNAWEVQIACGGIATGVVSVPLRYMHTPYEVVSVSDIENTAKLISGFLRKEAV